jgi:excisionase family DNA binding protein
VTAEAPDLPNKKFLMVFEVAGYYRVSEQTIRLWLDHNRLQAIRTPGRSIRVFHESVEAGQWPELPNKRLLLLVEIADYFRVTVQTSYGWLAQGFLEVSETPGRGLRVTRESVERCYLPYSL